MRRKGKITLSFGKFHYGGDPLSYLPIGQESMGIELVECSLSPALKGFIINRFI